MATMTSPIAAPSRPLVWILEDSPMEAAMAKRALATGYEVEVFNDGSTLLERMASGQTPTVLVLDLQLPGMTGIEVCRFLRAQHDESALPILMLTVYGHKSDLLDGLAAGANDYVTKPYDAAELVARVSTLARVKTLFLSAKEADTHRSELLDREQAARAEISSLLERERVARRAAEAANKAKDEFLAMVSHELRTPLNAILGWTRLLRGGEIAADKHERALATIERNAVTQTQLIEDLLDMSRILSGTLRIEVEPVELVSIVGTSIEAIRPTAEAKRIKVHQAISADSGRVEGDPVRLQQVVSNLLTNAVKFTDAEGTVTVALDATDAEIVLTVSDTGRGIEPEFLPHVFDRFRQAEAGPKRTIGGLGLGLAIVKHIVELHAGTITAASSGLGKGATFLMRLPRGRDLVRTAPASDPASPALPPSPLAGLRLLIVDDDPDGVELLAEILRGCGATVDLARSAPEAFSKLTATAPHVLVSDVAMPDEDGYALIRRIRSLPDGGLSRTPAIALTAFASSQDRTRALVAGFNTHVAKPVDRAELVLSIANLVGRFDTVNS